MPQDHINVSLVDPGQIQFIRGQAKEGASEADVIHRCIDQAREDHEAEERWLKQVAMPRYNAWKATGKPGLTIEEARANLADRRKKRSERAA